MSPEGLIRLDASDAQRLAVALGRARKDEGKALTSANRKVAAKARMWARVAATAGSPRERRSAPGIGSSATRSAAKLTIRNTARAPFAQATFYGMKRQTGWYKGRRRGARQHPVWIGNQWEAGGWRVGVRGEGPYAINDALAAHMHEIEAAYLDAQWDTIKRHVPTGAFRRV